MSVIRFLAVLCFALFIAQADDIRLIHLGDQWRFLKATEEPPVAWFQPGFNDSSWTSARSGFSSFGHYNGEATILSDYGSTYKTVYFRREFVVEDPTNIAELLLRIDYDDGFVAYLNGQEVARRGASGAPGVPVPVSATAPYHLRGIGEVVLLPSAQQLTRPGTNLLAVQILGTAGFDGSMSFVAELLANIIRGPYVQNTTTNSTQIIWKTASPVSSFIEYGTNPATAVRMPISTNSTDHVAPVPSLLPGREYSYRVINRFGIRETATDWRTFRTFKGIGAVRFNVVGDTGTGSLAQMQIADQLKRSPADFLMHVGDLVYYAMTPQNADLRVLSPYSEEMRTRPWFLAPGNHEMYLDNKIALELFFLPTNSITGTEHYYSFEHGDVQFVVAWSDLQAGSSYFPGSAQYAWLDAELGRSSKPWKFLFFHHTWRSSSVHQIDDYDRNAVLDSVQLDGSLAELARKHGVQIVFNGHEHCYERFAPSGGPASFVSGGGGATIYNITQPHPDSIQFYPWHHFLRVSVENDEAHVEAVTIDGTVFDQLHVRRTFPERAIHLSSWNSPAIESAPPNDFDGNILGQKFDFIGQPLNGPMGLFTSAGRMFVNNDRTNLYIGFDEVMLRAGEELFVFLEVPSLAGRATLRTLGNGLLDPGGEAVDALDFLSNLSFDNFSPAIAMILGDEFADFPSRNFLRTGQTNTSGQGAFYLAESLPAVSGQRLAQFNHASQVYIAPFEQNANHIELALPYNALGGVRPGDVIRVGAITALRGVDTNSATQTRALDTGGIGYSVRRSGGTVFLEGVQVRLASLTDADADGAPDYEEHAAGTDANDADSDDDGMTDGWELLYGLDPLFADAVVDLDLDGLSNEMEFRAGTDPQLYASRLFLETGPLVEDRLRLSWVAVPGKRYKLQARDSLEEPFVDLAPAVFPRVAQSSLEVHWIDFSAGVPFASRYYRVQLVEGVE